MWHIRYADSVISDDIPRLSSSIRSRIKSAIESKLMADPVRFCKTLRYSLNHLRSLRVGDYRVLYHLDHAAETVSIVSIAHRRDVYES